MTCPYLVKEDTIYLQNNPCKTYEKIGWVNQLCEFSIFEECTKKQGLSGIYGLFFPESYVINYGDIQYTPYKTGSARPGQSCKKIDQTINQNSLEYIKKNKLRSFSLQSPYQFEPAFKKQLNLINSPGNINGSCYCLEDTDEITPLIQYCTLEVDFTIGNLYRYNQLTSWRDRITSGQNDAEYVSLGDLCGKSIVLPLPINIDLQRNPYTGQKTKSPRARNIKFIFEIVHTMTDKIISTYLLPPKDSKGIDNLKLSISAGYKPLGCAKDFNLHQTMQIFQNFTPYDNIAPDRKLFFINDQPPGNIYTAGWDVKSPAEGMWP